MALDQELLDILICPNCQGKVEYREAEQKHLGYTRLRDADVLRGLVFVLRLGLTRTSGRPKSRAFVDFLFQQFPQQAPAIAAPAPRSQIILP